jgi:hypothetical protein
MLCCDKTTSQGNFVTWVEKSVNQNRKIIKESHVCTLGEEKEQDSNAYRRLNLGAWGQIEEVNNRVQPTANYVYAYHQTPKDVTVQSHRAEGVQHE